ALVEALDDADEQIWFQSLQALARIGSDAADAVPKLVGSLHGDRGQRHQRTAYVLSCIGPAAIPALEVAIGSGHPAAREGAARACGGMHEAAAPVIPLLIEALADQDSGVREQASVALARIGSTAEPALRDALARDTFEIRSGAAATFRALPPTSPDTIVTLQ